MPNLPQSPGIRQNSDMGISDFLISGQSRMKKKCHNSTTRDHVELKLRPVTKLDKTNKTTSKKFDNVMSANCDVIIFFPIYGKFGANRKPDSERIVCKTYIFINMNLLSYKN